MIKLPLDNTGAEKYHETLGWLRGERERKFSKKNKVLLRHLCLSVSYITIYVHKLKMNPKRERIAMTKRDLVVRIADETGLTQNDVAAVVQKTLDYISDELAAAKDIELRNFGVFEVKIRKSRKGRNPNKPEDEVTIPERVVVKFRPGKDLKNRVEKIRPPKLKRK